MATTEAETVADILDRCSSSAECDILQEYMTGQFPRSSLGYEDLFYPLRCHADDGLVLEVDVPGPSWYIEYGAGDLFYQLSDDKRTLETAVDPFPLWDQFKAGNIDLTPVLRKDTPFGEVDDD